KCNESNEGGANDAEQSRNFHSPASLRKDDLGMPRRGAFVIYNLRCREEILMPRPASAVGRGFAKQTDEFVEVGSAKVGDRPIGDAIRAPAGEVVALHAALDRRGGGAAGDRHGDQADEMLAVAV